MEVASHSKPWTEQAEAHETDESGKYKVARATADPIDDNPGLVSFFLMTFFDFLFH